MRTAAIKYEEVNKSKKFPQSIHTGMDLQKSETPTATRDFLDWWKWDSLGAACVPK